MAGGDGIWLIFLVELFDQKYVNIILGQKMRLLSPPQN